MTWASFYNELKGWQTGIGALLGFVALIVGALYNAHLNRRRDDGLRKENHDSIAIALYSEILLLREEAAQFAKIIAATETRQPIEINEQFLEDHQFVADTHLYTALSSKIGLLHPDLLMYITQFYKNIAEIKMKVPLLLERPRGRRQPTAYHPIAVLRPAIAAVYDVKPALRRIEKIGRLPEAKDPDIGDAEAVTLAWEEPPYEPGA